MGAGVGPILFVLVISATAVHSQILKGPANALKKVGDNVTQECVTSSSNCDGVEWSKMEGAQSGILVYRSGNGMLNPVDFPTQRYSVNSSGGCSLTITQLNISDSGRYTCSQLIDDTQDTKVSVLVVIDPVEKIAVSPSGPYHKGDRVRCVAKGHPFPTFSWTHLKSGNVVYGDTLVIMGDVEDQYTCTATNTVKGKLTSQIMAIEVASPSQLHGASIGIGAGIGVSLLIFGVILFAVLCKRYECIKRTKTDDKRPNEIEEDSERSRINRDDSQTPQYEPLDVLLPQDLGDGPTYEELTIPTEVDVTGQSVSNRAVREDKLNKNESSLTEYESLQQMELSPSDAYESIKPKKSDKNKKF